MRERAYTIEGRIEALRPEELKVELLKAELEAASMRRELEALKELLKAVEEARERDTIYLNWRLSQALRGREEALEGLRAERAERLKAEQAERGLSLELRRLRA